MTLVIRYRNLPVKHKLELIIMTTVSAALIVSCAAGLACARFALHNTMRNDLTTLAEMYGANSTAALMFGDQKAAAELLSGFRAKRSIVSAVVYSKDGRTFALYRRGNTGGSTVPRVQPDANWFEANRFKLFRHIVLDGQTIGTIYLESDMEFMNRRLKQVAGALLAILFGASTVALVLAAKLQTTISEPIRHLAQTAKLVSMNRDYRTRAKKASDDDLGQLTESFNGMLAEIERRDVQLLAHQELLEQKVAGRTAELALAKERAETACELLDQSRERLSLALDGASEALWDWDCTTNRTYYSERWSEMLGFTPEEIGDSQDVWEHLIHPDDYAIVRQHLQSHVACLTESYQAEYRMRTKDGGWRWIQARGKIVERAADGSPNRIAGTHLDITERKQAEQALARQHYILDTLIEGVPDHIYFKDRESRFIRVNHAVVILFGANDAAELIGKTDFDFFTEEHAARACADERDLLEGRQSMVSKEERETWPDGHESWVQTTKMPLRDGSDSVVGTFGISRDITDHKRMELALTAAKEAAEAASRSKSEFLANMSHEIRTPMNGIIGMTELALDTQLSDEQRDYLETVRISGDSLLTIINDILDFSKIEAGKLSLDNAEFDLDELLQETIKTVAVPAHQKGLELLYEYQGALPSLVVADAGRIRQTVINLLGNAVKFTSSGEVNLKVAELSRQQNQLTLQFTVSDTGIGVLPAWRERIFEAFVQSDASSTRSYGGTGLGLAISSRLVALMGGRIWFESEVGKGSTFHFTANLEISASERHVAGIPESEAVPGLKVLVVDDNATSRGILHETLIGWRMKPVLADSGTRALEVLRSHAAAREPFDLILLDAHMPEMDGFELARLIHEDSTLATPRIMMLSSVDVKLIGSDFLKLGLAHCVVKPVTRKNLLKTILKVAGPHQPTAIQACLPTGPETIRPLHVLVAENSPVNQRVALLVLEKEGHSVVIVSNGADALNAVTRESFDLILMDVQMPVMNGYEAARAIRMQEQRMGRHTPIVALTAHAMKGDRERCVEAGMDDYTSKPIQAHDLYEVLARWGRQHHLNLSRTA
jgi:PAS domain S-box-containing protein